MRYRCHFLIALTLIIALLPVSLKAADLGVNGKTYPIAEMNFLTFIQQRLRALSDSGKLSELQVNMATMIKKQAVRPTPVSGISRANMNATRFFDPSIIAKKTIRDQAGRIIVKKGTRVNPLSTVSLRETLIFYDGDDEKSVDFVRERLKACAKNEADNKPLLLILVKGDVEKQSKQVAHRIYFDQKGTLTRHFGIVHVPAIVEQVGFRLKITEIAL